MSREDSKYVMSKALGTPSAGLPEHLINCLDVSALILPAGRQLIRGEREKEREREGKRRKRRGKGRQVEKTLSG